MPDAQTRKCEYWWFDAWDWVVNSALRGLGIPHIGADLGEVALDPHIHTLSSHCSISDPDRVIRWAVKIGLGAVAVMDHDDVSGSLSAMRRCDDLKAAGVIPEEFVVIPGSEVNSAGGHIGALFVQEDPPAGLTPLQTVTAIHEAGGLAVAVHPYHSTGIGDAVFDAPFDVVEVECGSVFGQGLVARNRELADDARLVNIAKMGSSDAHYVGAIASCYTVVTATDPSPASLRDAIAAGHTRAVSSEPCARLRRLLGHIPKLR